MSLKKLFFLMILLTSYSLGIVMANDDLVFIEGGTFQMGSEAGENNQKPVHKVTLNSFYMAKFPVTQKEWSDIMGTTVQSQRDFVQSWYKRVNPIYTGSYPMTSIGNNYPMYYINWYSAVDYCNILSKKEGLKPAYIIDKSGKGDPNIKYDEWDTWKWIVTWDQNSNGYRLPTEAEWEYAAREGKNHNNSFYYSGSNNANEVAWYEENSNNALKQVGQKKPNALGLYDMSGNVSEWCWDIYGEYSEETQINPTGNSKGHINRIKRGGNWQLSSDKTNCYYRDYSWIFSSAEYISFRLVRNSN